MKLNNQDIECKAVSVKALICIDMYNRINLHINKLSLPSVTLKQNYEVVNQVTTNTFLIINTMH